jgi:hypothetical protein
MGVLFTANSEYMSYRRSQKILISVGQLDWLDVKDLDAGSQFERFSEVLLMSVRRIAQMKRKPRDFDFDRLENTLRTILSACPVADFSCSDQLHD